MMRMLSAWLRRPEWPAALLSVLYVGVVLSCVRLQYMSNDDVTIMDFARQGFQVRYMGVLLTSLMHVAYVVLPGVAWYGLILYGLNLLCVFLWLWLGFRVIQRWWLAMAFALVVFAFYLRHLAFLDYTATSALLCSAAVAWACVMVLEGGARWAMLLPGAAFMLGMMVRPHGVPGALLFTLPLWLTTALYCLRTRCDTATLRRLTLAALLFLLPSAAEFGLDIAYRACTATPQQSEYEAFNGLRGRIHRLSTARKHALVSDRVALRAAGMRSKDVQNLYQWNFLDERIYTPRALAALLAHVPPLDISIPNWRAGFLQRFNVRNAFFLLLLSALPLLLLPWTRLGWALIPALGMPLWYPLLTSGMSLLFIFPSRVEHPFAAATGLVAFVLAACFAQREAETLSRTARWCAAIVAVVGLVAAVQNLRAEASHYDGMAKRAARVQTDLAGLNRDFHDSIMLIQPQWGLPLEMLDPLRPVPVRFQPVQLGWSIFSPRFYKQIGMLGISHGYELRDALVDRPGAYILAGQPGWLSLFLQGAHKDGCPVRSVPVKRFQDGVRVFRLEEVACGKRP